MLDLCHLLYASVFSDPDSGIISDEYPDPDKYYWFESAISIYKMFVLETYSRFTAEVVIFGQMLWWVGSSYFILFIRFGCEKYADPDLQGIRFHMLDYESSVKVKF